VRGMKDRLQTVGSVPPMIRPFSKLEYLLPLGLGFPDQAANPVGLHQLSLLSPVLHL